MAKSQQSPPPYTSTAIANSDNRDVLGELHTAMDSERSLGNLASHELGQSGSRESSRLRNFILFTLSIDYHGAPYTKLSAVDRDHFLFLYHRLNDLYVTYDQTQLTAAERETLAPYFWAHLHEPCFILRIPVDYAVATILRFCKYMDLAGRYKGSIFGTLHTQGLATLAAKLHLDKTLIIPTLLRSEESTRDKLLRQLDAVTQLYFVSVMGIEGATGAVFAAGHWYDDQEPLFIPNERGSQYERQRTKAISSAKSVSKEVATTTFQRVLKQVRSCSSERYKACQQMATEVQACTKRLFSRRDYGQRAYVQRHHPNTPDTGFQPPRPEGFVLNYGTHLPDFFEHRPAKGCSDA